MTITSPERRSSRSHETKPAKPVMAPGCGDCGTDKFLIFEDYIPARYATDHSGLLPPSVSYTCSQCGDFSAHDTPVGWVPPGWHWYA